MNTRETIERPVRTARNPTEGEEGPLAEARKLGELEAEVLHLRLRLKESLARELRLVERAVKAEENVENSLANEHELRLQVDRYADFHRAVERSRAWKLVQSLRRLLGREW